MSNKIWDIQNVILDLSIFSVYGHGARALMGPKISIGTVTARNTGSIQDRTFVGGGGVRRDRTYRNLINNRKCSTYIYMGVKNHIGFSFWNPLFIFSSYGLKAQVSFSDRLLSVVCPFSSSSPEPLVQFQPNLAQIILGLRGVKFVQMKVCSFPRGDNNEIAKIHWRKPSFPELEGHFQP